MMHNVKGRSRTVPQNRFLRRLVLHFDLLQDETAFMNQATTILFLLANLYIQIVPTNNTVDSSLNMLLGSAKMVPAIFSAGFTVSIVLLIILLVSLIFEDKYLDRKYILDPPKHLKSFWYKFYKHLFRFHFLLLEPILSGYMLSLILPKSAFDVYPLRSQIFAIVGGCLGLLLSIPYFCFVESILPSSSWTSASNKYNIALTTIGLRLCIFLDYVYTSATDMALIGVLMVIRISPSIIATYINLFATHFFNRHARVLFVGYQVSNIIYSIIFFVMGNNSTSLTLIPACFFIALGLRVVYNMDMMSRANLQHLSANKLSEILTLSSHLTDIQKGTSKPISTEALRFEAVMAHLTSGRKQLYEEYLETFASSDEKAHDNERNTSLFMVYLFERCWQSSGDKDFRTLVYETLFAVTIRLNLFHISTLLARLHSLDLSAVEQSTMRALIRRIELSAKEIYLDKLSLIPVREQFYAPISVAESNEAIANKLKLNNFEDDSRGYGDQAKTHVTTKAIKSSDLLHFDIYSSMQTIEQYEKLVKRMQDVIFTILKFYEKLKNREVDVENAHETMKRIKVLKEKVNKTFRALDNSSGDQNIFHLLPYALFLETINNDRQASQKVLKAYEHRSQLLERSMTMSRGRTASSKFSLDQMLCIGVDCTRNSLGRMNYVSSNSEEVFGLHSKHFEGRNINTLMSDDFQTIHDEFLDKFVKDQDKPYLGVSRERHVRVLDNVYMKCDVLVKLSPVLNPTSLSFMCLLKKRVNDDEFMVVNHQGVIIGRSQGLDWAAALTGRPFSVLHAKINTRTVEKVKTILAKNVFATGKNMIAIVNASLREPEQLRVLPADESIEESSARHRRVEEYQEDQGDNMVASYGVKAKPTRFLHNGKWMFSDLIVKFSAKEASKFAEQAADRDRSGNYHNNSSNNSAIHIDGVNSINQGAEQGPSSKTLMLVKKKVNNSKGPYYKGLNNKDSESMLLSSYKGTSRGSLHTSVAHSFDGSERSYVEHKNQGLPKSNFANQLNVPGNNKREKEIEQIVEDERKSTIKSSLNSGSMLSTNVKARVTATVRQQRRYMAWKELLTILLIQVLIWSACSITHGLLNNSFNNQLRDLIDLRSVFGKILWMTGISFSGGITAVENMLVFRNRIPTTKYVTILPSIKRSTASALAGNIVTMQNWSLRLTEHIYSFDYDIAQRYLTEKYNYTYYYYGEDTEVNDTMTKEINMLDFGRECIDTISRWNKTLWKTGANMKFNNKLTGQYYLLMSKAWLATSFKTTANILTRDTESYKGVVSDIMLVSQVTLFASLLLGSLLIVIIWSLRKKTVRLYSLIENLRPFEFQLMEDRMKKTMDTLLTCQRSEIRIKKRVDMAVRNHEYNYHQYWLRNSSSRHLVRIKIGITSWLGVGWAALMMVIVVLLYQAIAFWTVDDLKGHLNRLIFLQQQQNTLHETTVLMSAIHFNAYYMAVKAANFGTRSLPEWEEFTDSIVSYSRDFDETISVLDKFVTQVPLDREETLNFKDILTQKPCDTLNFKSFGLPRSECESLADYSLNKSAMETFRWVRLQMPTFIYGMQNMRNLTDPVSFLNTREFLTYQFIRRNFFLDYVYNFTLKFFEGLRQYHQNKFVKPLDVTLRAVLIIFIILSILMVCWLVVVIISSIDAGLQIFLLVPPESYYHNPHIAAKLLTITN